MLISMQKLKVFIAEVRLEVRVSQVWKTRNMPMGGRLHGTFAKYLETQVSKTNYPAHALLFCTARKYYTLLEFYKLIIGSNPGTALIYHFGRH